MIASASTIAPIGSRSRDPIGFAGGRYNLFDAGPIANQMLDPFGTRFILVQEERTLREISNHLTPDPTRIALTYHELDLSGEPKIGTFRIPRCRCFCAYVIKSFRFDVKVTNWNPSDGLGGKYTPGGRRDMIEHEDKRISVKRSGCDAFIDPLSEGGSKVNKCGNVCRKNPGEASAALKRWLHSSAVAAARKFTEYDAREQAGISTENLPENQKPYIVIGSRSIYDGIKNKYTVKPADPAELTLPNCPKDNCGGI